jgi:hypothetical protein
MGTTGLRDSDGRLCGARVNVESVPRLPTFPARWVLADPRRRPYFVFWTSEEDGDLRYGLKMAPTNVQDAVLVTLESGETHRILIVRRRLPRGTGMALFYRCPWCRKPRRHLYLLSRVGAKLIDYLGLRCQVCAGLRFESQGRYQGADAWAPLPRFPWDPRAVSDPRMVLDEFPGLRQVQR